MTIIRAFTPQDVPAIKALLAQLQAFEAVYQPVRKAAPATMADDVWAETQRLLNEGKADVIVAEKDGAVIAVGIGLENVSGDLSLTPEARRTGYVSDLVVDAAWRGKGIGRQILTTLLDCFRARGLKAGRLSAIYENTDAIRLYQKLGFKLVAVSLETPL